MTVKSDSYSQRYQKQSLKVEECKMVEMCITCCTSYAVLYREKKQILKPAEICMTYAGSHPAYARSSVCAFILFIKKKIELIISAKAL